MTSELITIKDTFKKGIDIKQVWVSEYYVCTDANCRCVGSWGHEENEHYEEEKNELLSEGWTLEK